MPRMGLMFQKISSLLNTKLSKEETVSSIKKNWSNEAAKKSACEEAVLQSVRNKADYILSKLADEFRAAIGNVFRVVISTDDYSDKRVYALERYANSFALSELAVKGELVVSLEVGYVWQRYTGKGTYYSIAFSYRCPDNMGIGTVSYLEKDVLKAIRKGRSLEVPITKEMLLNLMKKSPRAKHIFRSLEGK